MTTETKPVLLRTTEVVELSRVVDNPWQPRMTMEPAKVQELADSIREMGLQQLPLLRPSGDGFQICFGHMRIAALRLLGFETYELEVRALSDTEMALLALTENGKRTDVPAIEQYRAWAKALEIEGMTPAVLAAKIGVNPDTVTGNLRILKLPKYILEHVDSGEMAARAAREFLCLMGEDHFHEDIAKEVMERLGKGAPDWRQARIRSELNAAIERRPVAEWRKLFRGKPGQFLNGEPSFDVTTFKAINGGFVHAVANDEWSESVWKNGESQLGKVVRESSRDWTCATSAWNKAQAQAKKSSEGVAAAAAKTSGPGGAAVKSSDYAKVLAADPVFMAVTPDSQGPLLKALKSEQQDVAAAAALGTRSRPALLVVDDKAFRAVVGEESAIGHWNHESYGISGVPTYFPDIAECRKTCTIGATYARFDAKSPFTLMCLNKAHFDEKVAKGAAPIVKKLEKAKADGDEADASFYEHLDKGGSWAEGPAAPLLLGLLVRFVRRFVAHRPEGRQLGWQEMQALQLWPANTLRIVELLKSRLSKDGDLDLSMALGIVPTLEPKDVRELVLRFAVAASDTAAREAYRKAVVAK